ncbi:unnamed protein product [Polarella glacialis]|uniref:Uncharacterized protein n=1 Tax=Polarella glacialis TaxID=89957 RepID=A0A813I5J8_POLGL|nr:unnamed protein product [Polarella glacialis]CAE8645656.1 unnamed protein product [Polarella glacialis]
MATCGPGLAVGMLALLWAGMSMGIVHDAGVKFSTPEVPRASLLRVGMHLFRSYRRVETGLACGVVALEAQRMLRGSKVGNGISSQLNRPLFGAVLVSTVHSHVFPLPYLLEVGDRKTAGEEKPQSEDISKEAILPLAHSLAVVAELVKISGLIWGAYVALNAY